MRDARYKYSSVYEHSPCDTPDGYFKIPTIYEDKDEYDDYGIRYGLVFLLSLSLFLFLYSYVLLAIVASTRTRTRAGTTYLSCFVLFRFARKRLPCVPLVFLELYCCSVVFCPLCLAS